MRIGSRSLVAGIALLLAAPRIAAADWPQFGQAIVTAEASQVHSSIASDGADGAIVTWQDFRFRRVNIFAMHVLASGDLDPRWPFDGQALLADSAAIASADGGQILPLIVADGAGGAIVAWQDLRTDANEIDLFAQHILSSGTVDPAWPANGRALVAAVGVQNELALIADGSGNGRGATGGAIATWMDNRPGVGKEDVFAQHVLASGIVDPAWPANGLAVGATTGRQEFPALVSDGAGGAIIAWDDGRDPATSDDVYAQHVLSSGAVDPAWPVNGRALCAAPGGQGRVTIAADGAGGAIVAWTDGRVANEFHIFAQHVLASGGVDPAWPVNGRRISDAGVTESRALAVSDGAGGAVVNWQAFTVNLQMYAQHVTAAGVVDPAWPAGGRLLSVSTRLQDHAAIVTDGAGGALVAWDDGAHAVAQHVFATGALDPDYPDTGRVLADIPTPSGEPHLVATGGGGAIVSWTDGRNGKDQDIYAIQVLQAGIVDVPPPPLVPGAIAFARPSPNPARSALTLRFTLPREAAVKLVVFDVNGRRVRELASGAQPAGEHAIAWDLRDQNGRAVGTGLYFVRLEAEGVALTQKLATLQ